MKNRCFTLLILLLSPIVLLAGEVRLHGKLTGLGTGQVELRYAGSATDILGNVQVVKIPIDAEGNFDITFPLDRPAYYAIGMNTLYLSPGDNLEVEIGRAVARSSFKGKGSEANIYLKKFRWNEGQNIGLGFAEQKPLDEVLKKVDSLARDRLQELAVLKEVSKTFREVEKARIAANRIAVYFSYIYRTEFYHWQDDPETRETKKVAYHQSLTEKINPLLRQIDRNDDYLECPAIREMLLECYHSACFSLKTSKKMVELAETIKQSRSMDQGITRDNHADFLAYGKSIKTPAYREAFQSKLTLREKLMEGQPAADLDLKDITGKASKLSDLKGKVLFVDFWATWCLPCLAQAPHVKELSGKYTNIQFVAISVDQEEPKWKAKLEKDGIHEHIKEFITNVYQAGDAWDIASIPRFLLIDKDFRIITAFAPRPSEKAVIEPLLEKYNR